MLKKLVLFIGIGMGLTQAYGGQAYSSHFCQPYKNGGTPAVGSYYQNQGSVYAASEVTLSCPISHQNINSRLQVRLTYSTKYATSSRPITCRIFKINVNNMSEAGQLRVGALNQQGAVMDLLSGASLSNAVGANIECRLKAGAKILGYYVY